MNSTQVRDFLDPLGNGTAWRDLCTLKLKAAENVTDVAQGLVRRFGDKPVQFVNNVWDDWGIDIQTCTKYCGRDSLPLVFDFPIFVSGVTNYFLPWLGLTAQLPYETGSFFYDALSFCLAVGSPTLVTFSLVSTAFSSYWISTRFAEVTSRYGNPHDSLRAGAKAAKAFLQGAQQAPMRINDIGLSELYNSRAEQTKEWWLTLKRRLEKTRRPVTFSLAAQTLFAVTAWSITIGASFTEYLGIPSQALLLSSGTMWLWLIAVVIGWVFLGMQVTDSTIHDALKDRSDLPDHCSNPALEARSGLAYPLRIPDVLWGNVMGDERQQGPVFNYARVFTFYSVVEEIASAFERKARDLVPTITPSQHQVGSEVRASQDLTIPQPEPNIVLSDHTAHHHRNQSGTSISKGNSTPSSALQTSTQGIPLSTLGSHVSDHKAYVEWSSLSSTWKRQFLAATFFAIFLSWGVIASALIIAYMTEVRGLSCHSGSYLLYGILSTLVFLLQMSSVFLSHEAMLLYQRDTLRADTSNVRRSAHSFICMLAVLTRYAGKTLAVFNTIWTILSALWELIGMYESCWCTGSRLHWGDAAWVILFVSPFQLRDTAGVFWAIGIVMSGVVVSITLLVVWWCSRKIKS